MNLAGFFFGHARGKSQGTGGAKRRRAEREVCAKRLRLENLETRDLMATLTWDGNGGNGQNIVWSAWNNWNPAVVPQSGNSLVFGGTHKLSNINDLNLSTPNIVIQAGGFNIDGNAINLGAGGIHFVAGNSANWSIPLGITDAATPIEVYGSRTLNLSDSIYGSGGIAKYGVGTAVLGAATSFTGATKVLGGTLLLNNSSSLAGSKLDYNNYGGAISFGSITATTIGGLTGSQGLLLQNGANAALVLTVNQNFPFSTYTGILSGSGGLTKTGVGKFTLAGTNTYTGTTTVAGGGLFVNGDLPSSSVFVASGALGGNGSVKNVTLNGGVVSPGDGVGTLTVANGASLTSGALFFELNDGVTFDALNVTSGPVSLGANLVLTGSPNLTAAIGDVFPLINNSGTGPLTGTFAGAPDGAVVTVSGQQFLVRYNYDYSDDGNANDVVLVRTQGHPTALDDDYTVAEDGTLTVGGLGVFTNDANPENEALTASLVQRPTHGQVTFSPDGKFTYKPDPDFNGLDSMIYEVADSQGGILQAKVNLHVSPVNDAPVVGVNTFKTVSGIQLNGTLKATDVDGPSLKYSVVSGPSTGQLSLSANGKFVYTPGAAGPVTFKFAVTDGQATVEGTATINVQYWSGQGIRPDVLEWIYANNPGLQSNFLETEAPDKWIQLPGGQSVQVYRFDQFLNQNFDIDLKSRRMEKVNYVEGREWVMRRLMALPEFYHWIMSYRNSYQIGGLGTVSAQRAYNYLRNIHKNVWVTATGSVNAPVGGGNGINAPSWAVWNQMNLLFHEVCHVINIGHNSGGLSGPLAGLMRDWERQGRQNYSTVNLNSITIWQ